MTKKLSSILIIVLIAISSISFPVYAGDTDEWLSDWDYEIKDLDYGEPYIWLNQYIGTDPDVTIYGKATVEGNKYPVCINVTYSNEIGRFVTGINCSEGIVNLTFESVDDTKVRSSLSYRLDDFFRGMENLKTIHYKFPNLPDYISPAEGFASFLGRPRGRLGLGSA